MIGFVWEAARGYRLRPWKSPYFRWRIETYSGIPAENLDFAAFWSFVWRRRRELARFVRWAERVRR
jgi:hypothetical protein